MWGKIKHLTNSKCLEIIAEWISPFQLSKKNGEIWTKCLSIKPDPGQRFMWNVLMNFDRKMGNITTVIC